jgi:PAS domain S-box-containing protein
MNYLQNVIDSASEIIFTIGSDLKIKTWNRTAIRLTGIKKSQVIGKSIKQLDLFEYKGELLDYLQTIFNGKISVLKELTINTSFGMKKLLSVSPSFMKDKSDNVNEILFVCRDITYETESHGSLIFGKSYLITEPTNNTTIELFKGFLRRGNPGLYICRTDNEEIHKIFEDSTPRIVKLTVDKDKRYQTTSSLDELLSVIKDFTEKEKNSIIFMDRIDYLIVNFSFEKMIKTLYELNDVIEKQKCLFLIRINPSLMDKTQMVMLYEEFKKLPAQQIEDIQLEEVQFDILNYINVENNRNTLVTYSDIGKTYSISKVTAQKRIESLKKMGMVFSKKQGRSKNLYITDKGKSLLSHRSVI